jgi:hypothetical protein
MPLPIREWSWNIEGMMMFPLAVFFGDIDGNGRGVEAENIKDHRAGNARNDASDRSDKTDEQDQEIDPPGAFLKSLLRSTFQ